MSPQWNAEKHFTKQYNRWLEDINRYESENGAIADHVKIATIINHLKEPINQHLMLKVDNTTTIPDKMITADLFSFRAELANM
eukprot:4771157-Amphidinium_carterae.1